MYDPKFILNLKPPKKELDMNEYQASKKEKIKSKEIIKQEKLAQSVIESSPKSAQKLPEPVVEQKTEANLLEKSITEDNNNISTNEKSDQDTSNCQVNKLRIK